MAATINTNIGSLNAQRNLTMSQTALATAMQRLSSGLRINSAKDDAAGLAISERFTTQIRGLNQAVRNANDGISLSQTAEGALGTISDNLQRIRELAVQSANATNLAEIDRVASQTSFNGQKILDGSFGNAAFQVGANVGQTINVGLGTSMRTADIGAIVQAAGNNATGNDLTADLASFGTAELPTTANQSTAGAASYAATVPGAYAGVSGTAFDGGNFSINGVAIPASANYTGTATTQDETSAYAKAAAINDVGLSGLLATATTELTFGPTGGTADSTDFLAMWSQGGGTNPGLIDYTLSINGVEVLSYAESFATSGNVPTTLVATTLGVSLTDAVEAINAHSSETGVVASVDANGNLSLVAEDGRNIDISESVRADVNNVHPESAIVRTTFSQLTQTGWEASMVQSQTYRGQLTLSATEALTLEGTTQAAGFAAPTTLAVSGSLEGMNVLTVADANTTLQRIDAALTAVNDLRSTFGAIQNRFESTIANLATTAENLTASRSRILDADFAQETANLSRAQILQQAGTAMVAQANQMPQGVLALLR